MVKNRDLIPYGCGLKVAYCSTAFGYYFTTGVPAMWMLWAWADLAFLALLSSAGGASTSRRKQPETRQGHEQQPFSGQLLR